MKHTSKKRIIICFKSSQITIRKTKETMDLAINEQTPEIRK